VARQRRTYAIYNERLADCSAVRLPGFDLEGGECPLWVDAVCRDRDGLDRQLGERGFGCRRFWHPLHTQTPYRHDAADLPTAARLGPRLLWLPTAFQLTDDDVHRACDLILAHEPAVRREAA
jgi:dTDP-4-amino-4,6-dideoxygalactose transaminase